MTDRRRRVAYYAHTPTALGPMLVAADGPRVVAIKFNVPRERAANAVEALHHELRGGWDLVPDAAKARDCVDELRDYLAGRRVRFEVRPDLAHLTEFQRRVLLATARVPRGSVVSYSEIARRVGVPGAFRAVGNALGQNPVPVVIPCHRVVGTSGIGGFGGGLDLKRKLLALEGMRIG
jgi:methylated-DNA-[protein]-cysteine S-methyltransferase